MRFSPSQNSGLLNSLRMTRRRGALTPESRLFWCAVAAAAFIAIQLPAEAAEPAKDDHSMQLAAELLKPKPKPARLALPASRLPLEFIEGERVALVGGSFGERMNLFGHFETLLHSRFPKERLV